MSRPRGRLRNISVQLRKNQLSKLVSDKIKPNRMSQFDEQQAAPVKTHIKRRESHV